MDSQEYHNIYNNEETHFYYVGTHNTVLALLKKYKPSKRTSKILDAGCGTGLLLKKLEKYGEVYGIDSSDLALQLAKKRGIKNLKKASVTKIPYQKDTFDVITSIDVLYHQNVSSDNQALEEFFRVLKPGGLLILKVPAYDWLRGKHDLVVQTKHRYSKIEVKNKVSKAGFQIVFASYANLFLLPMAFVKRLTDKFLSKHSSDVERVPEFINMALIKLNKLENNYLNMSSLPAGLSIYCVARKSNK